MTPAATRQAGEAKSTVFDPEKPDITDLPKTTRYRYLPTQGELKGKTDSSCWRLDMKVRFDFMDRAPSSSQSCAEGIRGQVGPSLPSKMVEGRSPIASELGARLRWRQVHRRAKH